MAAWIGFTVLLTASVASGSIWNNLAYESPSLRVRSLGTSREMVEARHRAEKRWDYYDGQVKFPYGIASGDPYPNSVILWTHPEPSTADPRPICLEYQVSASNTSWSTLSSGQAWTTTDVDYSWKAEAGGLQPKTVYYYKFVNCADGSNASPIGKFKTIPTLDDEAVDSVSFAVFSCSNYPFGFFNAYGNVARRDDVDYAMHVGDYIYEYQGDGCSDENACYGDGRNINRVPQPNREIWTLADYRTRYKTYRSDPDLQLLHQVMAWNLIWDDHEVADNTWKAGSADSNDTIKGSNNGTDFTQRKANAVKTYFEWTPIRQVETGDDLRIWRVFQFGKLVDLYMMDTRQYNRDLTDLYYNTLDVDAISSDEARSIMGGRQESWLYNNMQASQNRSATWKVLGQQIVFAHINTTDDVDAWDGYRANRRRVLDTISENKIDNVVILSGDSHANWVSDITYDNYTGYDPSTGSGSYAVEFAGTAVSSPSSLGYNATANSPFPLPYYTPIETALVTGAGNNELQWSEGATRGYFQIHFSAANTTTKYYGIEDVRTRNSNETLLATFTVLPGANKLQRPVAGGHVSGGVLKSQAMGSA